MSIQVAYNFAFTYDDSIVTHFDRNEINIPTENKRFVKASASSSSLNDANFADLVFGVRFQQDLKYQVNKNDTFNIYLIFLWWTNLPTLI